MNRASVRLLVQRAIGLAAPVLIAAAILFSLRVPITYWLRGAEIFDEEAIREWIREARIESANLPELVRVYLEMVDREDRLKAELAASAANADFDLVNKLRDHQQRLEIKREEIQVFLRSLGNPPTRLYRGQLPLFPVIYRLSVRFAPERKLQAIVWDSELPREASQYRELRSEPLQPGAFADILYFLHAYHQVQTEERREAMRRLLLTGLFVLLALVAFVTLYFLRQRQRRHERERLLAEKQASAAERQRLEAELRRQEAERRHEEAERQNLELKSQMFANIGIMAGSYAHNIKNLLVRPNDLLRRCLEEPASGVDQTQMLREVKETLGTVTERLQQILQTVRRDPSRSEPARLDLNQLVTDLVRAWKDLAESKWKMELRFEPAAGGALWIEGDPSHLQQAFENLLFNARDATFEMRSLLRERARHEALAEPEKRQAILAATAWRGAVVLRTRVEAGQAILEIQDNGIGMTDEVRARCTQPHFSTKRNNALFAGLSAGMGLGLSFITVILGHHRATLEIEAQPLRGATFRIRFPAAG